MFIELWDAFALLWYEKKKVEIESRLDEYRESTRRNHGIDNENVKLEEMRDLVMKAIQNYKSGSHPPV